MTTGKELELARVAADVKAKDLAAVLEVSKSVVSRWEKSRTVTPEAAERYMTALNTCITKSKEQAA